MICKPIMQLEEAPSASALLGSGGNQELIAAINRQYSDSNGVIFGQGYSPADENYRHFKTYVEESAVRAGVLLQQYGRIVNGQKQYIRITEAEQLYDIPQIMWEPILTYAPIRKLHEQGLIYGYGVDAKCVPEEDCYGRLINNGTCEYNRDNPTKEIVYEYHSDDPLLSVEDLNAIEATRGFIDEFLAKELGLNGDRKDPTDPANKIGRVE